MNTVLALPKVFYTLNFKNGQSHTVALGNPVDRKDLMQNPTIVEMDNATIDTSTIAYVTLEDQNSNVADTALAYAQTLVGPLRAVAVERVRSYEATHNGKMPLQKIVSWMESFQNNWEAWEKSGDTKFPKIYRQAGGK